MIGAALLAANVACYVTSHSWWNIAAAAFLAAMWLEEASR